MLRVTKNTNKIVSIQLCTKDVVDPSYKNPELDSFIIIPGVTQYNHIYSTNNWICFDNKDSYIAVEFASEGELDRFFTMLMREIKINQITNVSVDTKTK